MAGGESRAAQGSGRAPETPRQSPTGLRDPVEGEGGAEGDGEEVESRFEEAPGE